MKIREVVRIGGLALAAIIATVVLLTQPSLATSIVEWIVFK
ncbi:hypothetical protein [Kibdelosporangium philippinense]|nr:hypothetical protein [Kibdelosporangium philippinense]